jgi:ABC-2 type transport system permease protein
VNGRRIAADFRVVYWSYRRNPLALFFSLIFPLILVGLFGAIFQVAGSTPVPVYVVNDDHGSSTSQQFLAALNATKLVSLNFPAVNSSDLAGWLGQNDHPVGLVIPAGFAANYSTQKDVNVTVFVDPADPASSGTVEGAVQGVVNRFNFVSACSGRTNCTPVVGVATRNVGSPVYKYIDYLIPGLVGFSILTSPMFSLVDISSTYRKEGIFRELSLTPLTRSEWLTARIVWYVLLTFVSATIMITMGIYVFGAHVVLSVGLVPFLVIGPLFFVSLGMLCGSVARTPESAALIGNLVTFPMMFLSGTFFPVSQFPTWLRTLSQFLPLYYVIDGMNQVMLYQNAGRALVDVTVVAVLAVVVFLLAVRTFRWRDE